MLYGGKYDGGEPFSVPPMLMSKPCCSGRKPLPPRCHLPMAAVVYPAVLSASAIVVSASGSCCLNGGVSSFAAGHCLRPGIQSVRCSRAGYLPVIMLARVGEHTGQAA